jgi:hypothetical protein
MPNIQSAIVAGDFNTNADEFPADATLKTLEEAGFQNCMEGEAPSQRVTHPGGHGFPDTTFDYVLAKHATIGPPNITRSNASDHYPVTCEVVIPGTGPSMETNTGKAASSAPNNNNGAPPSPSSASTADTVTILKPVTILIPYGQTVLPAGLKLPVVSRDAQSVRVKYMGEIQTIPISSTDLR